MYLMLLCFLHSKKQRQCKNVFDAKMYLMQKCIFAKQSNAVQKCIFALNAFDAKMHFCITFYKGKCSAPVKCYKYILASNIFLHQQNVQHQMHFGNASVNVRTFYLQKSLFASVKCSHSFDKKN